MAIIGSDGFHPIAFVVSSSEVAGGKPDAQFAEFGMCADGASAPLLSAASGARLRAGPGQPSNTRSREGCHGVMGVGDAVTQVRCDSVSWS